MKINEPIKPFEQDFEEEQIYYTADIETFSDEIKKNLYGIIKDKKIKLVVFLGDILSFLTIYQDYIKLLEQSSILLDIFFDENKLKKIDETDKFCVANQTIGKLVSDYIQKQIQTDEKIKSAVESYIEFVKYCKRKNINILYYSGNHDFLLDGSKIRHYSDQIPILKKLWDYDNLYIPHDDLEIIQLNDNLFITGLHTHSDDSTCNQYPSLKELVNSLNMIENPEKTILVTHIPGKLKFSNLGSTEISNLKKRFKFKYHYHGHCGDYNGEYLEESVPTKSVHYDHTES